LIGFYRQVTLIASGVGLEEVVDEFEECLDALVLALVFAAFYQKLVVFLIVSSDGEALGTPQGGENEDTLVKTLYLYVVLGHGLRFA